MRNKRRSLGATPRGLCAVCHQGFADATDEEFKHRITSHLSSLRHMHYLKLQTAPPAPSGKIILKSKEQLAAIWDRARSRPALS